ncbi:WecB/TagA/CpsF family glycosyltransferase [Modestobacter roseus]|uniref:Exopolysaccharide biosynthesis WecB/TagA/CpsF family protein n=1 Tax=Modestobacter roseus TaxID=1181884 RepID=A0A562IWS9_9ACTN|nr:WecB/TagA/CpsF family glycosyltransferase [Modestobacter roseus]TWH75300.1 exopolysaccharide biosynthesis WecB/TagA/CpsF family protein [Modestobacter roseus]
MRSPDTPPLGSVVDLVAERSRRRGLPVTRPAPDPSADPVAEVAEHLARLHDTRQPVVTVSWVNHHSALRVLDSAPEVLGRLTYLGVDGLLLRRLLGADLVPRTSADLVLPELLGRLRAPRVAVVGGRPEDLASLRRAVSALLPPDGELVAVLDGYAGRPSADELEEWTARTRPTVVLAGLGAPLQDQFVLEVARHLSRGLVLTCGGFLDQVQQEGYYPRWAYPLKLNWLVRLAREPRRMWRRYSVDAVAAFRARSVLRAGVLAAPGFQRLRCYAWPDADPWEPEASTS